MFKEIADQDYLKNLFKCLTRQKNKMVLLQTSEKVSQATITFNDSPDNRFYINLDSGCRITKTENIRICFQLLNDYYSFALQLIESSPNRLVVEKPRTINIYLRRALWRYQVAKDEPAFIRLPSDCNWFHLKDISSRGVAFYSDRFLGEPGVFLHNVEIKLVAEFSDRPILADAELIYCKKLENSFLYGLRFPEPGLTQVFQYIFQNKYPNLKNLYEFPVDEIKSLFDRSGYFALKPREEMDRNFENMVRSHYRLRSQPQLSTNIAYIQNNNIISGASLLRIYNHTVLGQHLAGLREARRNVRSKTDIYLAFNDFGLNYNDFSYFISYFNSANEWHGRMYRRIGEMIHDENYFMVDAIGFFQCSIDRLPPRPSQSRYTVRVMENPAEFIAYCCTLKSLERDCYAYDEANINLEKVKALYRQKGMYLERRIYTVYQERKIVAYIVAESYTAGLNLYNILDMCRFYFTTTGFQLNQMMEAVLPEIASFFWQFQKTNFNVLLKGTQEEFGQIKVNGLEYEHLLGRVMISKRGFYLYRNALQVLFDKSRSLRYS